MGNWVIVFHNGCVLDFHIRSLWASFCPSFKTVRPIQAIHSAFF